MYLLSFLHAKRFSCYCNYKMYTYRIWKLCVLKQSAQIPNNCYFCRGLLRKLIL